MKVRRLLPHALWLAGLALAIVATAPLPYGVEPQYCKVIELRSKRAAGALIRFPGGSDLAFASCYASLVFDHKAKAVRVSPFQVILPIGLGAGHGGCSVFLDSMHRPIDGYEITIKSRRGRWERIGTVPSAHL